MQLLSMSSSVAVMLSFCDRALWMLLYDRRPPLADRTSKSTASELALKTVLFGAGEAYFLGKYPTANSNASSSLPVSLAEAFRPITGENSTCT